MQTEQVSPQEKKPRDDKFRFTDLLDLIELFVLALGLIMLVFTLLCRISFVQGSSMESTLLENDVLLVSDLFYTPTAGDIVVVQAPGVDQGKAIVKRVIATEGQTVEIKPDGVYVDGERLKETDGSLHYTVNFSPWNADTYKYSPMSVTLGEGELFVMGDHRSVSLDSRMFGTIDQRCVIGKVYFRILPFSVFGSVK